MTTTNHHDDLPTYNLKAVVQETGLKQDTLRAWERRYGIPQPDRTSGGHRLYSLRDIEILKWLVARQNEGLSISRAVDLWHRLESEGADHTRESEMPEPTLPPLSTAGSTIDKTREEWIDACLKFDERRAEQVLAQAAAIYSPEIVCVEFLQKGLADIGQRWVDGQISVQQEHFASALAVRRLESLIAASPAATRPGRIVVGCPPEELHVFSMLLVTFLLRRNGWDTLFLGANVPVSHLSETVETVKPNLVVLAAQQLYTAGTLLQTATILRQANIAVAFGGRIFNKIPALRARIPGHFLGEQLDQLSPVVQQILNKTLPTPQTTPISEPYQQALIHFHHRHPLIEAAVWDALNPQVFSQVTLSYWNFVTARNIIGALTLGSINFLDDDRSWSRDMLLNHKHTPEAIDRYFAAYYQAAAAHLDPPGAPILGWLAQFARPD